MINFHYVGIFCLDRVKDDCYPFGLTFNSYVSGTENKYKFQGQEEQTELGWVQFKWRNHDPALGRFFNVDPLAEDYVHNSPYAFSENKVTNHVELEGLESYPAQALFKQKFSQVMNYLGINETPSSSQPRSKVKGPDQGGGVVVTGSNAVNPPSQTAGHITGEVSNDGTFGLGGAGKFSGFNNAATAIANGLNKVKDILSEYGVSFEDSSPEMNNEDQQETENQDPTVVDVDSIPGSLEFNGKGGAKLVNSKLIKEYSDGTRDTSDGTFYYPDFNFYPDDDNQEE